MNEMKETNIRGSEELKNTDEFSNTTVLETLTDGDENIVIPETVPEKKEKSAVREIIDFFRDLAVCMISVFLITHFVLRPVQVKGSSMYPTLQDSALGFSNVLGYKLNSISRFDVVIIYLEEKDEYLVKRCIGLPGETISYKNGQLYVDGVAVEEDFLDEDYVNEFENTYGTSFTSDVQEITLGEDEYYCLGDNRPHSTDSRYYGPFTSEQITSKSVYVVWPLSQFGGKAW